LQEKKVAMMSCVAVSQGKESVAPHLIQLLRIEERFMLLKAHVVLLRANMYYEEFLFFARQIRETQHLEVRTAAPFLDFLPTDSLASN
jgi:hypothetical protein